MSHERIHTVHIVKGIEVTSNVQRISYCEKTENTFSKRVIRGGDGNPTIAGPSPQTVEDEVWVEIIKPRRCVYFIPSIKSKAA